MTVHFIGAGPGDPELLTIRGKKLIESCQVCLYAGSLVPSETVSCAPLGAKVIDTASMVLEDIMDEILLAHRQNLDVSRVHSGDPSLYGAIAEQIRLLKQYNIPYDITPGVPAYTAAAAALGQELTLPGVGQTVILTRTSTKSSDMPPNESLEVLAQSRALLSIHLSIRNLAHIEKTLTPFYGKDCPVVVAYRVGWPDQKLIRGTLSTIRMQVKKEKITRTALIFVGQTLDAENFINSSLYDNNHVHLLRPHKTLPE
jgi:precorrin-4/cobalt-precorrin-4 C11-methyltransferase